MRISESTREGWKSRDATNHTSTLLPTLQTQPGKVYLSYLPLTLRFSDPRGYGTRNDGDGSGSSAICPIVEAKFKPQATANSGWPRVKVSPLTVTSTHGEFLGKAPQQPRHVKIVPPSPSLRPVYSLARTLASPRPPMLQQMQEASNTTSATCLRLRCHLMQNLSPPIRMVRSLLGPGAQGRKI